MLLLHRGYALQELNIWSEIRVLTFLGNIEGEFNVINPPAGAPMAFPNGMDSM